MTSSRTWRHALTAFRAICDYPVKGVVYSHSHGDHWGGSPALWTGRPSAARSPSSPSGSSLDEIGRINGYNQPIMGARGAYQFGAYLPTGADGRVNVGAGPFLPFDQTAGPGPAEHVRRRPPRDRRSPASGWRSSGCPARRPTRSSSGCPTTGVLQSAECVQGECYPNLYTIRGDVPRPGRPVGPRARRPAHVPGAMPWPRATAGRSWASRRPPTTCATTATSSRGPTTRRSGT